MEHLLQAEHVQRALASVRHQMNAAKFPLHRDLAGFVFEGTKVDKKLVQQLSTLGNLCKSQPRWCVERY
jgi:hypothetical protein